MRFSPLWMVGTGMITNPSGLEVLGNVWPELPIQLSFPSSCPSWLPQCSESYLARISRVCKFWISISPSPLPLLLCAADSNCLNLT